MDRPRHQLLSRAVLPGDQHARGSGRHLLDALDHLADRAARPDDRVLLLHFGAEPHVFAREVDVLERVAQREQDAVGVERLLEEVVGAELRRLHGRLDRAVSRDHDHLGAGIELAQLPQRLDPVHALHLHVQEDEVGPAVRIDPQRLAARRAGLHLDRFVLEHLLQGLADPLLVVHHQDPPLHVLLRRPL